MKIGILQCDSTNKNLRDEHGNYPEMFMSLFKSVDPDLDFKNYAVNTNVNGEVVDSINIV